MLNLSSIIDINIIPDDEILYKYWEIENNSFKFKLSELLKIYKIKKNEFLDKLDKSDIEITIRCDNCNNYTIIDNYKDRNQINNIICYQCINNVIRSEKESETNYIKQFLQKSRSKIELDTLMQKLNDLNSSEKAILYKIYYLKELKKIFSSLFVNNVITKETWDTINKLEKLNFYNVVRENKKIILFDIYSKNNPTNHITNKHIILNLELNQNKYKDIQPNYIHNFILKQNLLIPNGSILNCSIWTSENKAVIEIKVIN